MRKLFLVGGALAAVAASAALAQSAVLVQSAAQSTAPSESAAVTAAASPVKALADSYVATGKTPGIVIAYARGDAPPTFAAAGAIAADAGAARADADSLWRVYSMTKPLTGMAAMLLIEEGKLSLDQPISDFIPAFRTMRVLTDPANGLATRPAARAITVRHLLTHTSGLTYNFLARGPIAAEYQRKGINPATVSRQAEPGARAARPATLAAFADAVAGVPLIADPGTAWNYSISLDVLARVIEVAGGMPFDRFLKARFFDPLGMKSSWFTVPGSEVGRLATNYVWAGDNRVVLDPGRGSIYLSPPSFPYGGAGLVMSARDYDRFLHMLLNEGQLDGVRVMKAETVRLAMSNLLPAGVRFGVAPTGSGGDQGPPMGYGAGGSVYLADVPGAAGKGTYGWGGAAGTIAWIDPTRKVRVTAMVNYMPSEKWPLRPDTVRAVYAELAR